MNHVGAAACPAVSARRSLRCAAIVVAMVAALAAGAPGAAQADRVSDARAQANREWATAQSEGRRLEVVVERYDGARVRLDETLRSIGVNEVRRDGI